MWTHAEIKRHTPFLAELSKPVRGWRVDARGNVGEDVILPAGAKLIAHDRMGCLSLLAIYGDDRGVSDVVMPDDMIDHFFFRLTDASEAIPDEPKGFNWCAPCQRYHLEEIACSPIKTTSPRSSKSAKRAR